MKTKKSKPTHRVCVTCGQPRAYVGPKLCDLDAAAIRYAIEALNEAAYDVAAAFNVTLPHVYNVISGARWPKGKRKRKRTR